MAQVNWRHRRRGERLERPARGGRRSSSRSAG